MIYVKQLLSGAGSGADGQPQRLSIEGLTTFQVTGSLDGSVVKLQGSLDGTTWFDVQGAVVSAPTGVTVTLVAPIVRAVVEGGNTPAVNAFVSYVR